MRPSWIFFFSLLLSAQTWAAPIPPVSERKVVFVVLDGVRQLELLGKAKDDDGKLLPARSLFPYLFEMRSKAVFLPNMRISNPAGVSFPAYADIFAGRRQGKILANPPEGESRPSEYPTIFETLKSKLHLSSEQVALISSWGPLCGVATHEGAGSEGEFFKSCGQQKESFKGAAYPGLRSDADTFLEFAKQLPKNHPRFTFLHFSGADSEGHFHRGILEKSGLYYGIFHYHAALQLEDYLLHRVWKLLQSDPYYKDQTYLIVTTDHGRDNVKDPNQWADHGKCVDYTPDRKLCSACPLVFGMVLGPGVRPGTVSKLYTHLDFAPTIAELFGTEMPAGTQGHLISEALPR